MRTLIELLKNEVSYTNRFANIVGPLIETIKNITRDFSFSELYEIAALSNVLKCNIRSIYPRIDYRSDLNIFNSTFEYAPNNSSSTTIFIFWTNIQNEIYARRNNAGSWTPNHFVSLLLSPDNSRSQDDTTQPIIVGSGSVGFGLK